MNSFNAIFEHSHIGIIVTSSRGIIEQVNPHANRIFGYVEGELLGEVIEVLVPKRIKNSHIVDRENYAKKPEPRSMGVGRDLNGICKSGDIVPVEISLCSYFEDGDLKLVSFINDISIRKKNEENLKKLTNELELKVEERTKELSQALVELNHTNENLKKSEEEVKKSLESEVKINDMKSKFVSMASHEFRTPLAGILSSVTLLSKYTNTNEQDKRNKHISRIKKSVNNLTSILTDFLSLDKLDGGFVTVKSTNIKVFDFFQEFLSDIQITLDGRELLLDIQLADSYIIKQDENLLRNIMINLVSNAAKYSAIDSEIRIRVNKDDKYLSIAVKDEGIGIPKKEQEQLFNRFFRADNVLNINGTGLGLSIVKRYLDLIKGTIEFDSKEGQGSTFKIKIPLELE